MGLVLVAGFPLTLIPLPPLGGEGTLTEATLLSFRTFALQRGEVCGNPSRSPILQPPPLPLLASSAGSASLLPVFRPTGGAARSAGLG
jgi:hypothetical protein